MKIVKKGGASDTLFGDFFCQIHVGGTPLGRNAKNTSPPTSPTLRIYNGLKEPTLGVGGRRFAHFFRSPCSQQGETNRASREAIVEGGGGLEGGGGTHDGAGYGEGHEGSLREHGVHTKVDMVYTPLDRTIQDQFMFQHRSPQLART